MAPKLTIRLDEVLRDDQLEHLGHLAIEQGLKEANRRDQAYVAGIKRPKRKAPTKLSGVLEDLGLSLPAAARKLLREHKQAQSKKPPSTAIARATRSTKKHTAGQ